MKNEKGQALIEFVLILPILIMFIFSIVDFGRIIITKNELENRINDIVNLLENDESADIYKLESIVNKGSNKKIYVYLTYGDDKYLTIKVETSIDIITPGLNLILGSPYKITSERVVIYNEK